MKDAVSLDLDCLRSCHCHRCKCVRGGVAGAGREGSCYLAAVPLGAAGEGIADAAVGGADEAGVAVVGGGGAVAVGAGSGGGSLPPLGLPPAGSGHPQGAAEHLAAD